MTTEVKIPDTQILLDHERLTVYQVAIDFVMLADEVIEHLPRGRAYLNDQLQRAALSIPLNIAEGAGEYAIDEKARFYRIAKRSATECAGILDVCQRLRLVDESRYMKGRGLLIDIVSMLIKMAQKQRPWGKGRTGIGQGENKNGQGHGQGHGQG